MISVVLYGRNDNYGYNLHKRAALSLNCIAEVLNDSDEILFVDYNTPNDFPTFPEAIADTLTKKAQALLRVLRVRSNIHDRFKSRTRLVALEPIARNIAVRRSNAANRWILSTNTDLIFIPLRAQNLSDICRDLAPGFYHAPRIELPETLWESMDRQRPRLIIDTVREWGSTLHLNEIVLGSDFIRYDGPGDFQLIQRSDLFKYHGFHEDMVLGWHVDTNIARRLGLVYDTVGDVGREIYGYHCDHTRQVTSAHSHTRTQNDWRRFVDNVERPDIPEQEETWGCPDDEIEEIRLDRPPSQTYIQALKDAIGAPLTQPSFAQYTGRTYNQVGYDERHVMPFLADIFSASPRGTGVMWYGQRPGTLKLFSKVWMKLGFSGPIRADVGQHFFDRDELKTLGITLATLADAVSDSEVFVFDFGNPPPPDADDRLRASHAQRIDEMRLMFMSVIRIEYARLRSGQPLRRIIAINAINNDFERLICQFITTSWSPFSGRLRHGFIIPPVPGRQDWLPDLLTGVDGVRVGPDISNRDRKPGMLAYGPYKHLEAGSYRLTIRLLASKDDRERYKTSPCVVLEVMSSPHFLGIYDFTGSELDDTERSVAFNVTDRIADMVNSVQARIRVLTEIAVSVRKLTLEPSPPSGSDNRQPNGDALRYDNWLPFLYRGTAGRASGTSIKIQKGEENVVAYGPYWPLPQGRYFLSLALEGDDPSHVGAADVICGDRQIAKNNITPQQGTFGLPFEITEEAAQAELPIEVRVFSSGGSAWQLNSVSVKPISYLSNWLPYLTVGPAGRPSAGDIYLERDKEGFAAFGPYWPLAAGSYVMVVAFEGEGPVRVGVADVVAEGDTLAYGIMLEGQSKFALPFEIPGNAEEKPRFIETRVWKPAESSGRLLSLTVKPIVELENWLPYLQLGGAARMEHGSVSVPAGVIEFVLFGPYWKLPPGRYELTVAVVPDADAPLTTALGTIDVAADGDKLAECNIQVSGAWDPAAHERHETARLLFEVTAKHRTAFIETRLISAGGLGFSVRSVSIVHLKT